MQYMTMCTIRLKETPGVLNNSEENETATLFYTVEKVLLFLRLNQSYENM